MIQKSAFLFYCYQYKLTIIATVNYFYYQHFITACYPASFHGVRNIALGKQTFSSSFLDMNFAPGNAVDGIDSPSSLDKCFLSLTSDNEWWVVDLGEMKSIATVVVTNRDLTGEDRAYTTNNVRHNVLNSTDVGTSLLITTMVLSMFLKGGISE